MTLRQHLLYLIGQALHRLARFFSYMFYAWPGLQLRNLGSLLSEEDRKLLGELAESADREALGIIVVTPGLAQVIRDYIDCADERFGVTGARLYLNKYDGGISTLFLEVMVSEPDWEKCSDFDDELFDKISHPRWWVDGRECAMRLNARMYGR